MIELFPVVTPMKYIVGRVAGSNTMSAVACTAGRMIAPGDRDAGVGEWAGHMSDRLLNASPADRHRGMGVERVQKRLVAGQPACDDGRHATLGKNRRAE